MLTPIKVLTLMSNVNEALDDYVASHTSAAHPYLYQLYRATHTQLIRPRMASGPLQGRFAHHALPDAPTSDCCRDWHVFWLFCPIDGSWYAARKCASHL